MLLKNEYQDELNYGGNSQVLKSQMVGKRIMQKNSKNVPIMTNRSMINSVATKRNHQQSYISSA